MAVPHLHLCDRTQRNLGAHGIEKLQRELFAIDCQLCGASLGDTPPAVRITQFRHRAIAQLHHMGCGDPAWVQHTDGDDGDTRYLTYHIQLVVYESGPFRANGLFTPILLLNPSMETAYLRQNEQHRWEVDFVEAFCALYDLIPSGYEIRVPPLNSARIDPVGVQPDGKRRFVLRMDDKKMPITMPRYLAETVEHYDGAVLVVTAAFDPHLLSDGDFTSGLHLTKALDDGACAVGWAPLVPSVSPRRTASSDTFATMRKLCKKVFTRSQ